MSDDYVPYYRKISTKFVVISLLFSLLPLVFLYFYSAGKVSDALLRNIEKDLRRNVHLIASQVQFFSEERAFDLRVVSQADVLETENQKAIHQYLSEVLAENRNLESIIVTDKQGGIIASASQTGLAHHPLLIANRGVQALIRDSANRKQGEVLVSEPLKLQEGPGIALVTPITDETNTVVIKTLVAEMLFQPLERFITLVGGGAIAEKQVHILDRAGRVVLSTEPEIGFLAPFPDLARNPGLLASSARPGNARNLTYTDSYGNETLAGIETMGELGVNGGLGWTVLVAAPKNEVLMPVSDLTENMLVFALIVAGVTVVIVLVASRRIIRPILDSAAVARRVSDGDYDAQVAVSGTDEIGILARAINRIGANFREVEETRRRTQRMEAIGQLTGGIAHDFNNLLGVILGNIEALGIHFGKDDTARPHIEAIERSVDRGSALTDRLLAFSRQQALSPRTTDISNLIHDLEDLLRRTLGETIKLEVSNEPDLWPATIDPYQLENALINLALNARDAMEQGGVLDIETRNVTLDETYASQFDDVEVGDYVMVTVSDNGTGMVQDVIDNAFEPFFTTKDVGVGSGLGLSMVYGFVKQSNGHITIYSEEEHGTTVKLYMPRSAGGEIEADPRPPDRSFEPGSGRILVVEDDDNVRKVPVDILTQQGYEVVEARDGEEAITRLKEDPRFDLLFTDVVLPGGMNGVEIAEQAERINPGIKVLYTTGYSENAVIHNGRLDPGVTLVDKPYRRAELLDKISSMLAGASILLVEDDDELRSTMSRGLQAQGFDVTTASGGIEGFEMAKAQQFDVVVLDVVMSDGEGIETLKWFQDQDPEIPIIGISGRPQYLENFRKLGALATLAKPFTLKQLVDTIASVLEPRA